MELQKAKIAMYAKRPFGDKLNATFDFIKENWKILLKFTTYLILPLCLVQALVLNAFMSGSLGISVAAQTGQANPLTTLGIMFWVNYGLTILCYLIGSVLLTSFVYLLMKVYNEREERLVGVTLSSIRSRLMTNIGRSLKMVLFMIAVLLVFLILMGLLVALTPFTLVLTFPLLFACFIPMALLAPIYLFEEISLIGAFKKTFRLGFATWGGIFGLTFVLSIISGILQGVTMLPWYVATVVKYFFAMSDTANATTISPLYSFFLYLLGIVQGFGAYLSMILGYVGLAYQYGHASEIVDSISVEEDIENFDKL